MTPLAAAGIIFLATVFSGFGALLIKLGAAKFSLSPRAFFTNYKFLLGGIVYVLSVPIYVFGLQALPVSVAYPLTSLSYVWVTILSATYLKEKVDTWRWVGIACIIIGIVILNV